MARDYNGFSVGDIIECNEDCHEYTITSQGTLCEVISLISNVHSDADIRVNVWGHEHLFSVNSHNFHLVEEHVELETSTDEEIKSLLF